MDCFSLVHQKIRHPDYAALVARTAAQLSAPEQDLLAAILQQFEFDPVQEQALVQAVLQQQRFDPMALHVEDDEDVTGVCLHCLNPPAPPLRDYEQWRRQTAAA